MICLLVTSFAGCSTMGPSSAVEETLKEMKTKAPEELSQQFEEEYVDVEAVNEFYKNISDFEYKIIEEKVDGDTAEVTVEITTYPFGEKFADALVEALGLAFSAETDEEVIASKMFEKINDVQEKSYSKTVTIHCEKKDGQWTSESADDNKDLADALLGGMMTATQDLEEAFQ